MSLIVKFLHGAEYPGCEDTAPSSIYSDVTSIHFPETGGDRMAHLWVREPVKTAMVPGFCENEKHVLIGGPVYVMNEAGKTVSVFRPQPRPAPHRWKQGDIIHRDKIADIRTGDEGDGVNGEVHLVGDDGPWLGRMREDGSVMLERQILPDFPMSTGIIGSNVLKSKRQAGGDQG